MNEKKQFDLKVLEVKNTLPEVQLPREVDSRLPTVPGLQLFIARCRSGKCLDGDCKVKLKNGELKILKDVVVGDYVKTKEGYSKVKEFYVQGKKECVEIRTESTSLRATLEHKIDTPIGLKRLKTILSEKLKILTTNGYEEIVSHEHVGKLDTYDIEVDNTSHTFYANNISVKNSNMLMNFLFGEQFWGGPTNIFDVIYYVSPTCRMDKSTQILFRDELQDKVIVYEDMENVDAFIKNVMDYQDSFPNDDPKNPKPLVCIVIDDANGSSAMGRSGVITNLATKFRHYNINIIYSNQNIRGLPSVVRAMADSVFLAKTTSVMERQKVMEEYGDIYGNKLLPAWDHSTQEPYHFAYLKLDELVPKLYKIGPTGCNEIDYNQFNQILPNQVQKQIDDGGSLNQTGKKRKGKKRGRKKKIKELVIKQNE